MEYNQPVKIKPLPFEKCEFEKNARAIAREATEIALHILDNYYPEYAVSAGPCGDRLAYALETLINGSILNAILNADTP